MILKSSDDSGFLRMYISLRPSGLSLLIGFIDVGPAEIPRYVRDTAESIQAFREHLKLEERDCDHYKVAAYVGLGKHNLITFTVVREQGFAAKMAFLGNVQGQSFFYAHEYDICLDLEALSALGDNPFPLLEALAYLSITDIIKVRKKDLREWDKVKEMNGENIEKSKLRNAFSYEFVDPQQPDRSCKWDKCLAFPIMPEEDYAYMEHHRSVKYGDLYSGEINDWKNGSSTVDKCKKMSQLVYLCQLRINSFSLVAHTEKMRTLAFLGLVLIIHESWEKDPKSATFVRPFFTDGYFDMGVVTRSENVQLLDNLMQKIKLLKLKDVFRLMDAYSLTHLRERLENAMKDLGGDCPVFVLCNSSLGVPYSITPEKDPSQFNGITNLEDLRSTLEKYQENFHLLDEAGTIVAETRLSIKNGRTEEVVADLNMLHQLYGMGRSNMDKPLIEKGRYDLELFPRSEMEMKDFICRLFFANIYLNRRSLNVDPESSLFYQRIRTPILEIRSTVYAKGENIRDPTDYEPIFQGLQGSGLSLYSEEWFSRKISNVINKRGKNNKKIKPKEMKVLTSWQEKVKGRGYSAYTYNENLLKLFKGRVSDMTLERFLSTLSLVENYLQEPLLYDVYLDVHRYCSAFIESLFWLDLDDERDLVHYLPNNTGHKNINPRKDGFKGFEAFFNNASDLLQEVLDQRQAGSFPEYDLCVSRLTDLRLQHLKKVCALSWLIGSIRSHIMDTSGLESFWLHPENFLVCFRNSPLFGCDVENKVVYLSAQFLASNELVSAVVHEIGHSIYDPVFQEKKADLEKKLKEINNAVKKTGTMSNKEKGDRLDLWQEVMADSLVFWLCFYPNLEMIWGSENQSVPGHSVDGQGVESSREQRVRRDTLEEHESDICTDFVMTMIFQFSLLPRINSAESKLKLIKRIIVLFVYLRHRLYGEQVDEYYVRDRAKYILTRINEPLKNMNIELGKIDFPNGSCLISNILKGTETEGSKNFLGQLALEIKEIPNILVGNSAQIIDVSIIRQDVSSSKSLSDFQNKFMKPQFPHHDQLYRLLQGVVEKPVQGPKDIDIGYFCQAMQLAGIASLGFVQMYNNNEYRIINGHPILKNYGNQLRLARVRRLISACLIQGKMHAVRGYLDDLGVDLTRRKLQE